MPRLTSIVCSLITSAVERFRDWTAHRSTFEEIQLRIDGYRSEAEVILPKLRDALELIREHAPIRRVVRCIQVCYIPHTRGQWHHNIRTCMLHLEFVQSADTTLEEVASVIIHEATHGRIRDRGITYGEDQRDAVERVCIAEQIRFLKRLPTVTEEMIAPLQQRMDYPTSFWSNASRRASMFATARLKLKETGCPQWLMWPLLKLLDRREKKLQARETKDRSPR